MSALAGAQQLAHDAAIVAPIDVATAVALRRAAIRPDDPDEALCRYLGDCDGAALHLGLIIGGIAVGSISCVPDPLLLDGGVYPWRRRGFCIVPSHRGGGLGRWFYGAFLAEITARAMVPAWGTSRESLVPFYVSFGLRRTDNVVEFPGTGLHRVCLFD